MPSLKIFRTMVNHPSLDLMTESKKLLTTVEDLAMNDDFNMEEQQLKVLYAKCWLVGDLKYFNNALPEYTTAYPDNA